MDTLSSSLQITGNLAAGRNPSNQNQQDTHRTVGLLERPNRWRENRPGLSGGSALLRSHSRHGWLREPLSLLRRQAGRSVGLPADLQWGNQDRPQLSVNRAGRNPSLSRRKRRKAELMELETRPFKAFRGVGGSVAENDG